MATAGHIFGIPVHSTQIASIVLLGSSPADLLLGQPAESKPNHKLVSNVAG
jgi:hypothetical protein